MAKRRWGILKFPFKIGRLALSALCDAAIIQGRCLLRPVGPVSATQGIPVPDSTRGGSWPLIPVRSTNPDSGTEGLGTVAFSRLIKINPLTHPVFDRRRSDPMSDVACCESWQCHNVLWFLSLYEMEAIKSLPMGSQRDVAACFDRSGRVITKIVEVGNREVSALPLSLSVRRQRGYLEFESVDASDELPKEVRAWCRKLKGQRVLLKAYQKERSAQRAANAQVLSGIFMNDLRTLISLRDVFVWIDFDTGRASAIHFMRMPTTRVKGDAVKFSILDNHPDMIRITCAQKAILASMAPMYASFFAQPFVTIRHPGMQTEGVIGEGIPQDHSDGTELSEATGGLVG
jgi:hypothetical protein